MKIFVTFKTRKDARAIIESRDYGYWHKISATEYRGIEESLKIVRRRGGYALKCVNDWAGAPDQICTSTGVDCLVWCKD